MTPDTMLTCASLRDALKTLARCPEIERIRAENRVLRRTLDNWMGGSPEGRLDHAVDVVCALIVVETANEILSATPPPADTGTPRDNTPGDDAIIS
ncbi:hypothetical protein OPIT5_29265 [Opitutaceae bacterium TAV5]|nr:hypothetical protein OPIT5_21855 [Opitutaceae bacterium TAV5]AHF94880.1 hypothetical protein OPIT5_29265 [Opitutaceae bacterium TAV5]